MGIKANKVITILNFGIETTIGYLKLKQELEPTMGLNPNSKLTDGHNEALTKECALDMYDRVIVNKLFQKKSNKEKEVSKHKSKTSTIDSPQDEFCFFNKVETKKVDNSTMPIAYHKQENNKDNVVVTVLLSNLHYEINYITYKRGYSEFVLWEKRISRHVNSEKTYININNVSTKILLYYSTNTFQFVDASKLLYVLDLSSHLDNEKFGKQ